ncbi:hypothetical protein L3V35_24575, partial [Vibrio sp. L5-1]|nr:hypothetical protein [Vibrio sp. L5-1]
YFTADFNHRFAKPAQYPKDMHRPVRESKQELDDIFSWQETRKSQLEHFPGSKPFSPNKKVTLYLIFN